MLQYNPNNRFITPSEVFKLADNRNAIDLVYGLDPFLVKIKHERWENVYRIEIITMNGSNADDLFKNYSDYDSTAPWACLLVHMVDGRTLKHFYDAKEESDRVNKFCSDWNEWATHTRI